MVTSLLQAGMIRTEQEEFFIEPLERGDHSEEEVGRRHVVYRSAAVKKPPANRTADFYPRGQSLPYSFTLFTFCLNNMRNFCLNNMQY